MPIAAVPVYLGKDFKDASPALRFGMYLKLWGVNRRTNALLWKTHDVDYEVRGEDRREREVKYENKVPALSEAKRLNDTEKKTMLALLERQESTFRTIASAGSLRLDAQAVAPFTTGLGNEHPLENGFAFLNPYGLPYLPGSGVKGVLRQAALELATGLWGNTHGWRKQPQYRINVGTANEPRWLELSMLDVLFGREAPSGDADHVRGALSFWDVIPQIAGDHLMVEIMTPHQSHYYQQKAQAGSATPHDSGQPTPICFLTVPPGSEFTFHVVCDLVHLKHLTMNSEGGPDLVAEGPTHWKPLLAAAFEHAFCWLGFGAKTAVGYGAMKKIDVVPSQTGQPAARSASRSRWLDDKLRELCSKPGIKEDDALRGKALAEAVRAIEDEQTRREALVDIVHRWKEKGWWEGHLGGAAKKAKAIYDELLKASS